MRPVNLIPPDEQRGEGASLRTGSLIYVLLGGLALLLLAVVAVALTSKQVSDRKAEKASLEQELQQETARADSLAAFANFRAVQETRAATVTSLAQSRFDWTRVLQELSLVLPENISLSNLTGTVSPEVSLDSSGSGASTGSGTDLRSGIAGPALQIAGCAPDQDAVAGFVSALEDIDGVTRVGLSSSGVQSSEGAPSTGSSGGESKCIAGPQTYNFEITVAFDAVPAPPTATAAPTVPSAVAPPTGTDGGVAAAQTEENVAKSSVREQTTKAQNAQSTVLPGG
jgi:Tfp pilus assembly protein PilN